MDSKDTKSSHPSATHREVSADTDSDLNQHHLPNSKSTSGTEHVRPGEAIMKSDDPSTAALRAWAEDKQLQVPGSDGSFAGGSSGTFTGGVIANYGGPWLLPRNEFIVDPPYHSMDHGPVSVVKHEEDGQGKKKRHSISDLFKKKGEGKSQSEGEVQKEVAKYDGDEGKREE